MSRVQRIVAWVQRQKPVRVFVHYGESRGPLMAGGLSYQAIFAVFAALWVGFSVAGLFLQNNDQLREAFFSMIGSSIPGLIDTGDGSGAIDPDELLEAQVLGWTGAIALVGLLFTAFGWLASCRDAIRTIFGLPPEMLNIVLLKLKDVGLGIAFGAALVVSSALLVFSTQAADTVLGGIGFDEDSLPAQLAGRAIGLVLMFILDTAVLAGLYRALSGLAIPIKRLLAGSMIGAAGLGVLKVLGSALLGGATNNPLLASFAIIIGLLIWFNLICQVVLLASSWISVGMADAQLIADPKIAAAEREKELKEAEKLAKARAEYEAATGPRRSGVLGRLFGRRKDDGGRP